MSNSKKKYFKRFVSDDKHPLLFETSIKKEKKPKKKSQSKSLAFIDPLQAHLTSIEDTTDTITTIVINDDQEKESNNVWRTITAISIEDSGNVSKIEIPAPLGDLLLKRTESAPLANTPEARLQWLESTGQENSTAGLNHQEFLLFIEACSQHLSQCWREDQRVKTVKVAIQLSKMLSPEYLSPTTYPTVFFAVADLISSFGQMVFDRLVSKSPQLRVNFNFEDVSSQAIELCKNWLYKIASIRGNINVRRIECLH